LIENEKNAEELLTIKIPDFMTSNVLYFSMNLVFEQFSKEEIRIE